MEIIKVNGHVYSLENANDLQTMQNESYYDWFCVRTANATLLSWQYSLYLDELDRQDEKASTGSYGKLNEVDERINYAIANHARMYLHDVRCRKQSIDDQRIGKTRIEHKTGFAQWAYGPSYDACMEDLQDMASKGIIWKWDAFKDGRKIEMPLADLLEYLASYNPSKGLKVWFNYVAKRSQLQIQPVQNSAKRREWIENLLK